MPELALERAILPEIVSRAREQAAHVQGEPPPPSRRTQRTRERLQAERARVLQSYRRGWITEEECAAKVRDLDAALAADHEEQPEVPQVSAEEVRAFLRLLREQWPVLPPADRRLLLQSMIRRIVPDADDLPESLIEWR